MEIDLSQFHQSFFDEAAEHLNNLEELLLNLNVESPEDEDLNAIFRAVHSIKGSAATFGFIDLSQAAHIFENLLDQIRQHRLTLTVAIVDLSLEATDMLSGFLAVYQEGAEKNEEKINTVCAKLKKISENKKIHGENEKNLKKKEASPWKNVFAVQFECLNNIDLNPLWEDLKKEGDLENLNLNGKTQHFQFSTDMNPEKLESVLDFVAVEKTISIEKKENNLSDDDSGAYGFFAPLEEEKEKDKNDFGDYGFFEPLPPTAAPTIKKALPQKPLQNAHKNPEMSIRVSTAKVDQLINLVGELVMAKSMLLEVLGGSVEENELLNAALAHLERNSRDLQEAVMGIRMLPLSFVFSRFPRVIHDLSTQLGKKARLEISGENTEIDKGMIEKITDPLTHLIRNSLDHGIEMPDERVKNGKNEEGLIRLTARHQGGSVVIEVGDDGAGLNKNRIVEKAKEKGIPLKENMSERDIFALICEPGFSTAQKVSAVSGRGVGMDVVRKNLQLLGGHLEIDSVEGLGTQMRIFLPLTLAILDGMSVKIGKQTYIVPLSGVEESLQIQKEDLKTLSEKYLVRVRGEFLPLIVPHLLFHLPHSFDENTDWGRVFTEGIVIVLTSGHRRAALFVDALLGQHQVVIKSIESNYHAIEGFSGASILGNGEVALIFDPHSLIEKALPGTAFVME